MIPHIPRLRLAVPATIRRTTSSATLSMAARLIASGAAQSKAEIATICDLSRTTVAGCIDQLLRLGIVQRAGKRPSAGRGRPADALELSPAAGTVIVIDGGARTTHFAIADAAQNLLAHAVAAIDVRDGPQTAIAAYIRHIRNLLAPDQAQRGRLVVVLGVPARLDYERHAAVRPPVMPGWDGFDMAEPLEKEFQCPIIFENDVNLRALGESRALAPNQSPLLAVKVGTGIGGGMITGDGALHRGCDGASGELGHVVLRGGPPARCGCGNIGCLEAVASVPALLARYRELGGKESPAIAADLVRLVQAGDPVAATVARECGTYLGEVVADMVNVFNPARVILGGEVAQHIDDILAQVRAEVYQRARPLATRNLVLARSVMGELAGIGGGIVMGVEHLLSPKTISATHRVQAGK